MASHFLRIGSRPRKDLARGYSYLMGEFGNEEQAHHGLSGYSVTDLGAEEAVATLNRRMGVCGEFVDHRTKKPTPMYCCLFEGVRVGMGPDGEGLFRPSKLVASWRTSRAKSPDDLLIRLIRRGFS